jgi:hypothetical protein
VCGEAIFRFSCLERSARNELSGLWETYFEPKKMFQITECRYKLYSVGLACIKNAKTCYFLSQIVVPENGT